MKGTPFWRASSSSVRGKPESMVRKARSGFAVSRKKFFVPQPSRIAIAEDLNEGSGVVAVGDANGIGGSGEDLKLAGLLNVAVEQEEELGGSAALIALHEDVAGEKRQDSSGGTFWLMAAIRMKERRGPGMVMVSTGVGGAGRVWSVPGGFGAGIGLPEKAGEAAHRPKIAAARVANVRRGNFIGGYLLRTF